MVPHRPSKSYLGGYLLIALAKLNEVIATPKSSAASSPLIKLERINMYQTSRVSTSQFAKPTAEIKIPKTKTAVIQEAVKTLNSYHPNQKGSVKRSGTLKATFVWLCKDIPEDRPEESAKAIFNYVRDTLALRAN